MFQVSKEFSQVCHQGWAIHYLKSTGQVWPLLVPLTFTSVLVFFPLYGSCLCLSFLPLCKLLLCAPSDMRMLLP